MQSFRYVQPALFLLFLPAQSSLANYTWESSIHVQQAARLFAIGGGSSTSEAYDFSAKTWTRIADMPAEKHSFGATSLDGRVYAVGGLNAGPPDLQSVIVYSPTTNKWTTAPPLLNPYRDNLGVSTLGGKIYAMGGAWGMQVYSTGEVFDPQANKWTYVNSMSTLRNGLGVGVAGGYLYAVGGCSKQTCLSSAERYDPQKDTWSPVAPMNIDRFALCVATVDGRLFAIGGSSSSDGVVKSVESYDQEANMWIRVADMPGPRSRCGAVGYDGLLYVVGGYNGTSALDTVDVYNPKSNVWATLASRMSIPRSGLGVACLS